jgi:hypothetical protein
MTSINSWLRHKSLFFTFFSLSIFTYGLIPVFAQTQIRNTAGAGADNLPQVTSNEVTLSCRQASSFGDYQNR